MASANQTPGGYKSIVLDILVLSFIGRGARYPEQPKKKKKREECSVFSIIFLSLLTDYYLISTSPLALGYPLLAIFRHVRAYDCMPLSSLGFLCSDPFCHEMFHLLFPSYVQLHKYTQTHTHTYIHTVSLIPAWENQCEWHRRTRRTGPDCAVMCNLINTHTHTHTHFVTSIIDPPLGGSMRGA